MARAAELLHPSEAFCRLEESGVVERRFRRTHERFVPVDRLLGALDDGLERDPEFVERSIEVRIETSMPAPGVAYDLSGRGSRVSVRRSLGLLRRPPCHSSNP
jgi:hypothetical protein